MASFTVVKQEEFEAQQEKGSAHVLRCLTSGLSCLTRQDGSVSLSQGDTTSIAVVYGPAEVRINKEQIDKATVEVIFRPKVGLSRPEHRKQERIMRNTLEPAIEAHLHPRSSISIIIQETEDLGSNLACCINSACLALLDAAINMNYMVAAVSVAVKENEDMVLDPSKQVEKEAKSIITYVFDSVNYQIVTIASTGSFSRVQHMEALKLAREASKSVFQFYRESVAKKLLMSE
ncbi:exosome complex component rrp46-like [Plakobranchus ocellatus]|uniref:Exosome complex component rrp46-like n=1 Tax=Plakobranchus ocellatus TaxID=259542 RepID=A0AAV4D254_9GAST|nr:exosome complex component rrp46-like [Plakobranchus ocellatus]